MANKVYPDAASALDGLLRDGMTIMAGGFGLCGIPEKLIAGDPRLRGQGPDRRLEQCRDRRRRARAAARNPADPQDDLVLCRREQAVRRSLSEGRTRARIQPAGHARRAHPRRRRRHSGLLHQDRGRHAGRRGQGDCANSTARPMSWSAASSPISSIVHAWKGDREGNLVYRKTARNFNPVMATAGTGHGRRGRASGRARRDRPRPHPHAGHFRAAHRALPDPTRSASSSARCASAAD